MRSIFKKIIQHRKKDLLKDPNFIKPIITFKNSFIF